MQKMKNNRIIKRFLKMQIGNKITLMYAGVFAVILILSTMFIILNAWYFYHDISKKELDGTITEVANYIKSGGKIDEQSINELNPNKYVEIRVTNLTNKNKFEIMDEPGNFPPPEFDSDKKREKIKYRFETEMIKGKRYMYHERFVEFNNEKYFIQVFRPYYHEQKIMRIFAVIFIGVNISGIFIAFGIGRFISKRLLKPITDISITAESISINDLSQRINVPLPDDEIRTLAVTFNDMISRLEISFNKQKQFISDASHELRTPISVIQGYANLMDRWGKSEPEILQESIDSIKDETQHMSELIKKLLFLANDEQNKKSIQKEALNLNEITEEVIKEFKLLEDNSEIYFERSQEVYICGDFDLIKQLICIFIENAIKYSSDKRKIYVYVYKDIKNSFISIKDNGIGIKDEDIPYIFDRFFRGDKSRSKEIPGNGLGLSIAQWIVKQHSGNIEVKSKGGEGTEFIVKLPVYGL